MSAKKPREIAIQVLQGRRDGIFVEDLLDRALTNAHLSPPDRGLCQELVYGIVRWQAALDWLITRKTDQRAQKPLLHDLLRLGLYQIFWLNRIPNHAAVHETVELAKSHRLSAQAGFINAVLRGYLREFDQTNRLLSDLKATEPWVAFSHPKWLVEAWLKRWGAQKTAELLQWNNTPPRTFARVNTLKTDPGKLLEQWRAEDVEYDFVRHDWLDENLVFELKAHPPLASLPSFNHGGFYVQDPSTLLAVRMLSPDPGESVLDLCAAPGGKLTYMAQVMGNQGRLVAHDTTPERLKLIQENCTRLGVTSAHTILSPNLRPTPNRLFDRVLVDAPCSNTGVMRRRVELRWRIQPHEISRLKAVQRELLDKTASLLKPGGVLVYSTCSLEPEENDELVAEFLQTHPGWKSEARRELLPFADAVDGAFAVKMLKST